jgi:CubicO group peptidase (beta-lactamase class C family)
MKYLVIGIALFLTLIIGEKKATSIPKKSFDRSLYEQCKKDFQTSMIHLLIDSMHKAGNYSGVLLVAENGNVIFKKAYGRSWYDTTQVFTVNTAMQLASVSKPFTAMAILILAEKGLVNYHDDITKYFPNLKYKGITVKHLLNHTSGLPDYLNRPWLFAKYIGKKSELTNEGLLEILEKNANKLRLDFTPGKQHRYSNTGYALLALIVERASGMSFKTFMSQHIFMPLGMTSTFIYDKSKKIKMLREEEPKDGVWGDKGVFSTVDDMLKWDQALYTEKLIKRKTLEEAFSQGVTLDETKFDYGYGWRIAQSDNGEKIIYHKGLWQGANPMLIRIVECNRTVISLNPVSSKYNSWEMVYKINRIMNESEKVCAGY